VNRRDFLALGSKALVGLSLLSGFDGRGQPTGSNDRVSTRAGNGGGLRLFLAGDVMTGRGIDQVLPRSVDPELHEPFVKNAERYVELAEAENGEIPKPVPYDYIWGDGLELLAELDPAVRIINLETSVTTSDDWWPGKGIHYRMHPANVEAITSAGIDACVLGNNHVLDWGRSGLLETLTTLQRAGPATPGAGRDQGEAQRAATLETGAGRVLVFSYGTPSAGVPLDWQAGEDLAGVNVLADLGAESASRVARQVERHRRSGDRVVMSLHWGGNWGYEVPRSQREFAHRLIDEGAADIVHGHSSHHPKGIEVYRGRLILYGCGDLLNDYEGISGQAEFRSELVLMYFPELASSGALAALSMAPMRVRRFRLQRATAEEAAWLAQTLDRESREFGSRVELTARGRLELG
jgi:poly-gamma-glutamate capsule biosynthesis protein CapA/YwtB (metallophosphatase superfamily)